MSILFTPIKLYKSALRSVWVVVLLSLIPAKLVAMTDEFDFTGNVSESDYRTLISQLRCLVCQNESLASSRADLAEDLKKEVYGLMSSGKSNSEVKDFLVQRYGDFVLYRPPFKRSTLILWAAPFLVLLIGGFILISRIKGKSREAEQPLTDSERKHLQQLLEGQDDDNQSN